MIVPPLPANLNPPAPFPTIVRQAVDGEFVAPGARRARYRLETVAGPLVVNVVALDTREPALHLGCVLANDRMISAGETVSGMAKRTGAIAGVNADYFDIGNTNQPLNAVVQNGALLRTPSKRIVLDVRTDGSVHYDNLTFTGSVSYGGATLPLTGVNEWPPQGGVTVLTPAYGALKTAAGVSLAEIVPADTAHLAAHIAGNYRVASIADATAQTVHGMLLGFGPAAKALAPLPAPGDSIVLAAAMEPSLDALSCAVGGGPLLLADGRPVDDPNAPAPEERARRFPVSGSASTPGGEVLLISVDGRQPALSIGVTRPEFAALMESLGASDGMAFDSGGSATLVARVLGDAAASVLNAPSDGAERPVADGFFAYSDAPAGPASMLVVRPSPIRALPGAVVPLRLALVDAAGHARGPAHLSGGDALSAGTASSVVRVRAANLASDVPVAIVTRLGRLELTAQARNPDPGATVELTAQGFDAQGRGVEVGRRVRWSADRGSFVAPGMYRAPGRDARIVAEAGGVRAELLLPVGRHRADFPLFDAFHAPAWSFASAPQAAGAAPSLVPEVAELRLPFDFSGDLRAIYANGNFALPGEPLAFTLEVEGDRSGVGVRAAFVNRFGERRALTLASSVDWLGWREQTVRLPDDLNPPVQLVSLYVVRSPGGTGARAVGSVAFRRPWVVLAGNP